MNQLLHLEEPVHHQAEDDDPYRYGWRYVRRTGPDGKETTELVPLSYEDLLYPEEGDFVVDNPLHVIDFEYCHGTLAMVYADQASVVVLGNCRVDWGVEGVRPLGPDILVLFAVRQWLRQGTFRIAVEGGQPMLVLEITSPNTRGHDLYNKPDLYYRAGVQCYVIVDRGPRGEDPVRLTGFYRGPHGWVPQEPDAQGRLDLSPVGVLIGIENNRPWLYDAVTGQRLGDRIELRDARVAAEVKARDETQARVNAEAKMQQEAQARADAEAQARDAEAKMRQEAQARADAEAKARQEAQARADAEAQARNAEAKMRQEAQARTDAEAKARDAEAKIRQETQARADAEAKTRQEAQARADAEGKVRQEAQARADLEQRLRELEDQLRRQQEQTDR
jgi:hypothetical protein